MDMFRVNSSRLYGSRTKKLKLAVDEIGGVAADSESTNTVESDTDTDTEKWKLIKHPGTL